MNAEIRDKLGDIQRNMLKGYQSPMLAAEDLVEATALLANVQAEELDAELEYNRKKVDYMEVHKTASKAEAYAKTTPEWVRYRKAQNTGQWLEETIRTLKHYGNSQRAEMSFTR